ncbi:hypothetical protein B484DRAFT_286964 [Ochromonadaceae sp. CCMP2298]|nr:hypothetical protein B484DRAFT_286964 [Ochromonadaceae sp. CCMP2298]
MRAIVFILLSLCSAICTLADHIPVNMTDIAKRIFTSTEYPCASKCGGDQCIASAWDATAAQSKNVTAGCDTVLYSIAIDDHADTFNHIDQYWKEPVHCSILYLSANSMYLRKHPSAEMLGNWTIVPVKKLDAFTNNRKAAKIPKLFPHSFFADSVEYALYVDAKIQLTEHPTKVLSEHLISYAENGTFLTVVGHPFNHNVTAEVRGIDTRRHSSRPYITHDFALLEFQRDNYTALNITGQDRMVDTAIMMHDLRSAAARPFFCTWQGQLQKFSDRDQISLQGTLGWFSRGITETYKEPNGTLHVGLRIIDGSMNSIRILPTKGYFWAGGPHRFSKHKRQHWNH